MMWLAVQKGSGGRGVGGGEWGEGSGGRGVVGFFVFLFFFFLFFLFPFFFFFSFFFAFLLATIFKSLPPLYGTVLVLDLPIVYSIFFQYEKMSCQ